MNRTVKNAMAELKADGTTSLITKEMGAKVAIDSVDWYSSSAITPYCSVSIHCQSMESKDLRQTAKLLLAVADYLDNNNPHN